MSKCALCASVLLYSRDQCTVALGPCCSADACARSRRVYWTHCTVCAPRCTISILMCCAALHCVCRAALPFWRVGSGSVAMHCHTACGQGAVELLQFSASLPVGRGQWKSCNAPPYCLEAAGSATAGMHRHTARGQWAVELLQCTAWGQWAVELLQCTATLPGGSGLGPLEVWCGVVWCGVPKALLPEGNGRDVYPLVQVNGRAVCVARALCASVFTTVGSGGMHWSPLLCPAVAAAGPMRRGGACAPALAAAQGRGPGPRRGCPARCRMPTFPPSAPPALKLAHNPIQHSPPLPLLP